MKRKILLLSLVLTLILTVIMPTSALAAKPLYFEASGIIDSITTGEDVIEFPAGQSGRWVVKERAIGGTLGGIIYGGDINGDFTLTYKANVVLETQAGTFHGEMVVGDYDVHVNGKSSIGITPIGYPGLILSGHWNFTGSDHGNGTFYAWIVPDFDGEGHIIGVLYGGVTMTGQW